MRLFVSLPLSTALRGHVRAIAGAVFIEDPDNDVRWVPPENFHVTIKFLGTVGDAEVPDVVAALGRMKPAEPIRIAAGEPDPRRHRGRVHLITVEVKDIAGQLAVLHDAIERELEPLGFARDKRAFWPHVTIGRSRAGVHMRFERFSSRGVAGAIDRFELLSSRLGGPTPVYVPVATFPLT
jgi:2'-5' RNA ligase